MARYPTLEGMVESVAIKALNEYIYKGKTIAEWVELIKEYEEEQGLFIKDKQDTLERITEKLRKLWRKSINCPKFERAFRQKAIEEAIEIIREEM